MFRLAFTYVSAFIVNALLWMWAGAKMMAYAFGAATIYEDTQYAYAIWVEAANWLLQAPAWVPALLASALTLVLCIALIRHIWVLTTPADRETRKKAAIAKKTRAKYIADADCALRFAAKGQEFVKHFQDLEQEALQNRVTLKANQIDHEQAQATIAEIEKRRIAFRKSIEHDEALIAAFALAGTPETERFKFFGAAVAGDYSAQTEFISFKDATIHATLRANAKFLRTQFDKALKEIERERTKIIERLYLDG